MPKTEEVKKRKYPKRRKRRAPAEIVENRAKGIITDLLQGKTLRETGEKYYPNARYPAQQTSNALNQPTFQRVARMLTKDYTPDDLRKKAAELMESGTETTQVAVLRLAMQEKAMLVERQQVQTVSLTEVMTMRNGLELIPDDLLQDELMKRLSIKNIEPIAPVESVDHV